MPRSNNFENSTLMSYTAALVFVIVTCLLTPAYAAGTCDNTPKLTLGNTVNVGNSPRSAITRDINGDGHPDVIVANLESSLISILPGDGAGGFGTPINISVGTRLAAVEAGDFNGDNKIDLVVSSLSVPGILDPHIIILLGDGTGNFTTASSFWGGWLVESIAVADFNNDGKADLALADQYNNGQVHIRYGDGTGNFTGSYSIQTGERTVRVIAQDFNGDGSPDLAVAKTSIGPGHIAVFSNNGTGLFTLANTVAVGDEPSGLVAGDFNNDGKADLAVSNRYARSVSLLLGDGAGGFGGRADYYPARDLTSIAKGDFNNDGRLDIVTGSGDSRDVTVILGDGSGGFSQAASFSVGAATTSVAVGDFDNDGKADVVVSRDGTPGSIATLINGCTANSPQLPNISINDITVQEGASSNQTFANFSITLSAPSDQRVTVQYGAASGTATQGADFAPAGGAITFEPGETSKTVSINIYDDGWDEDDETFMLHLASPVGGTIVRTPGVCTIVDNDPPPLISASDLAPIPENNTGTAIAPIAVRLSNDSKKTITIDYSTEDGTARAGSDYIATSGSLTFAPGETLKFINVQMIDDNVNEPNENFFVNLSNPVNVTIDHGRAVVNIFNDDTPTLLLEQNRYSVSEGAGGLSVTVKRIGDPAIPVTVDYATSDVAGLQECSTFNGRASSRCDYATTLGTLRFANGELTKTITIPLVDDSYAEGAEGFTLSLSNPSPGAALGVNAAATIIITDNDATLNANPVTGAPFFIRQQYIDFLGREPDPAGYAAWQNILNGCSPGNMTCDRVEVSSAFFRSPEFQARGYFIYRFYSAALGRKPNYSEFMPDLGRVSGFLSDAQLESNKMAFVNEFVTRAEYVSHYGSLTSNQAYVDALLQTAGLPNHPSRGDWIDRLNNGTATRAEVLRALTESLEAYNKFYTEAFVVMQYFGYLRRDPDASYLEWIRIMNLNGGDYRPMISGFINSNEYVLRFGP